MLLTIISQRFGKRYKNLFLDSVFGNAIESAASIIAVADIAFFKTL
jgi:hypothetical protein